MLSNPLPILAILFPLHARIEIDLTPLLCLLHEPTVLPQLPKRPQIWCLKVTHIVLAHDRLDRPRGLGRVVKGNTWRLVVHDVVLDGTVDEHAADPAEIAVDRRRSAAREGPGCVGIVGEGGVGVLEECDDNCIDVRRNSCLE